METEFWNGLPTRQDVVAFAKSLQGEFPDFAKLLEQSRSGNSEWSGALWNFFDEYRRECGPDWNLYPKAPSTGGRAKGEFLVDFALFDGLRGCRIACECEWGGARHIFGDFDKLCSIKADLKILVFQHTFSKDDELPPKLVSGFREPLGNHHHCPNTEFYVFFQFNGINSRVYLWTPPHEGPFGPETINFERIDGTWSSFK